MNLEVFEKKVGIKISAKPAPKPYVCQYCGTGYTKEATLVVHMCEQKRRHLAKTEKHVLLGYQTYIRFFELTQKAKHQKTYEEFAKSSYYNAFVKFGSFLSNVNPLYPDRYIDYIVTSGIKLDHWCREDYYYDYVLNFIKKEPAEVALQRSIDTMIAWAEENNSQWNHYFKFVNSNRAVYHIKDGKISPWLVLNSKTGRKMLSQLNEEQLALVAATLDVEFWQRKFKTQKEDVEFVKSVAESGNL
jgi:hypothetical protein